jgi:hypothetical protein
MGGGWSDILVSIKVGATTMRKVTGLVRPAGAPAWRGGRYEYFSERSFCCFFQKEDLFFF